jgi:hypothetical protein
VKYQLFLSGLMKLIFWTDFENYSHIKFNENESIGRRSDPRGRTGGQTGGQTDMTKLIVAFGNFANVPKNQFTITQKCHTTRVTAKLDYICSITQIFQLGMFHDQEYLLLTNK